MKLRIPPLIQFLGFGACEWVLAKTLPELAFSLQALTIGGGLLVLIGALMLSSSVFAFVRNKTTVNPVSPEKANTLVTDGLYRYSRNPMYVGMASILWGGAFLLQNIVALCGPIGFVITMTYLQIKQEEEALKAVFGEAYEAYRKKTRRWL